MFYDLSVCTKFYCIEKLDSRLQNENDQRMFQCVSLTSAAIYFPNTFRVLNLPVPSVLTFNISTLFDHYKLVDEYLADKLM